MQSNLAKSIIFVLLIAFSIFFTSEITNITYGKSDNSTSTTISDNSTSTTISDNSTALTGVVMKGGYVNMKQERDTPLPPPSYIEDSFKLISQAGLNHVRFLFYWEAYVKNPELFMKEIKSVAEAADKWNLKVLYDNHQWHTSSWLEKRGTGFPSFLFENNAKYQKNGGGNTQNPAAKLWWADWWDGKVKDAKGQYGWQLQADFLTKIVNIVDNKTSTLGYEILSEPHVDNANQWSKIGKFNTFMTSELRKVTNKIIAYSMDVPVDIKGSIDLTPENLAKMAPDDKQDVVFKISVYGVPDRDAYQRERFNIFLKTREITGIPLYIGEWNNVVRVSNGGVFVIDPAASKLTEKNAGAILNAFEKAKVWATAFWKLDFNDADTDSFNLVLLDNGTLKPTKYYDVLKRSISGLYGSAR